MKTLYLLRHAKSSWDNPEVPDLDRPLAPRGWKAARRIGCVLCDDEALPELVLCSPARRAVETLAGVLAALTVAPVVRYCEALYLSGWPALLQVVQELPPTVSRVMLVAHDPDLHDLARRLAGAGASESLRALAVKFPTGALAVLEFAGSDWTGVAPGAGLLRDFIKPRDLS